MEGCLPGVSAGGVCQGRQYLPREMSAQGGSAQGGSAQGEVSA